MIFNVFFKKTILIIAFIALIVIFIFNIIFITEISNSEIVSINNYYLGHLAVSAIIAIELIAISYLIYKIIIRLNDKRVKWVIIISFLLIYASLQLAWICAANASPKDDSAIVVFIAQCIKNKVDLNPKDIQYIQYYPNQLTLTVIISIIFKIFNTTNSNVIQCINVVANITSIYGLYKILLVTDMKNKSNKVLLYVIAGTFIPIILLCTFVYGDIIGLSLAIWSIYFAMQYRNNKKIRFVFITAIILAIAYSLRMNSIIFMIAIIIYWFIDILEEKNKKQIFYRLLVILLLTFIVLASNKIIKEAYSQKYHLNKEKSFSISNYLNMGLNTSIIGDGWWNPEYLKIIDDLSKNDQKAVELEKEINQKVNERIRYLLKSPLDSFYFFSRKIINTWTEPTMESLFINNTILKSEEQINNFKLELYYGKIFWFIQIYQKALIFIIIGGSIFTIIQNRKSINTNYILLLLVFLGGFTFHLIWETKSRYIIPYIIILIPLSCIGISEAVNRINDIIIKRSSVKKSSLNKS